MYQFIEKGYLLLFTCSLTIFSCSYIIWLYIFKENKSYGFQIIFILCFSDLGNVLMIFIQILRYEITGTPIDKDGSFCLITGSLKVLFLDSSCTSTILITWTLYKSIILKNSIESNFSLANDILFVCTLPIVAFTM